MPLGLAVINVAPEASVKVQDAVPLPSMTCVPVISVPLTVEAKVPVILNFKGEVRPEMSKVLAAVTVT